MYVLSNEKEIICILGVEISESYKVLNINKNILKLNIE